MLFSQDTLDLLQEPALVEESTFVSPDGDEMDFDSDSEGGVLECISLDLKVTVEKLDSIM